MNVWTLCSSSKNMTQKQNVSNSFAEVETLKFRAEASVWSGISFGSYGNNYQHTQSLCCCNVERSD